MPTHSKLQIRTHKIFQVGKSFIDTPKSSRFLHISTFAGAPELHCLVDKTQPIEWRCIVGIPSVDLGNPPAGFEDNFQYVGAITEPGGRVIMYFLDTTIYGADCKPLNP